MIAFEESLADCIAEKLFGIGASKAISEKVCISCKSPIDYGDWEQIDIDEYLISALCPDCFSKLERLGDLEDQTIEETKRENRRKLHIERN